MHEDDAMERNTALAHLLLRLKIDEAGDLLNLRVFMAEDLGHARSIDL